MKKLIIISGFIICLFSLTVKGQSGAKIYGGITTSWNSDEIVTPSGKMHSGWVVGIDARLQDDPMHFLVGVSYGKSDLLAQSSPTFFGKDQIEYFKGRIGLGFDLIKISPRFFITSKIVGSIKFINDYDSSLLTQEGYKKINDGTGALVGGLGIRIGVLNVDLEYERGMFNMYNLQKESKMHYLILTTGFNF